MAIVKFTSALKRFYPDLKPLSVEGATVAEIVQKIDQQHPGLGNYLLDDQGQLRKHVNIFIGNQLVQDKEKLQDQVEANDEVFIMQALSGG